LAKISSDPSAIIYAHNAQFEMAITHYRWAKDVGTKPPLPKQWRCTATMARLAALPASLEKVGEALRLDILKDKDGSRLIKRFSVPHNVHKSKQMVMGTTVRVLPIDDPEDFRKFGEYCLQDVRTEQEVHRKLSAFELRGALEQAFMFDSELNDRGLPINVRALRNARRIVQDAARDLATEFRSITGLNHSQTVAVQQWLSQRGYPYDNLQANSVEDALSNTNWSLLHQRMLVQVDNCIGDDEPIPVEFHQEIRHRAAPVVRALELHSQLSFAAVKKIDAMLACDCGDGYVRGTLRFYGANTGRWSGQLIQPQNFKRPTIEDTAGAYQMICDGCSRWDLEAMYGDPIEVVASCIRHFIQPHDGAGFLDADYAAIEARIVCWLADQHNALDEYRAGKDRYVTMAAAIYNKHPEHVTKHERWVGKQAVLGCGFSMWVDAFQAQCAKYGVSMEYEACETAVLTYRKVHNRVESLWEEFENAARAAIVQPGKWFQAGSKVKFAVTKSAGIKYLVMLMPSGRRIVYPHVAIEQVKRRFKSGTRMVDQITFWGPIPGKAFWGRISTYGGKLVENATQGTAFDLMAHGSCTAEARGFELVTLIHDQALAKAGKGKTVVDFCAALCDTPAWAAGLPLVAEGSLVPYYRKD
jgi:DNA polymerase